MEWLRLVGSLRLQVSFAKEPYKRDYILQNTPIILRSLTNLSQPIPENPSRFRQRSGFLRALLILKAHFLWAQVIVLYYFKKKNLYQRFVRFIPLYRSLNRLRIHRRCSLSCMCVFIYINMPLGEFTN